MPPKFKDLKNFCEKNGWELTRDSDHFYYRKILNNGEILRTKVSHSLSKEIPNHIWMLILKKQLRLSSEEEFWSLLKKKQKHGNQSVPLVHSSTLSSSL